MGIRAFSQAQPSLKCRPRKADFFPMGKAQGEKDGEDVAALRRDVIFLLQHGQWEKATLQQAVE